MPKREKEAPVSIGEKLRLMRKATGMTQARLAEKAGISPNMVLFYENGKSQPSYYAVERMLDVMGFELVIRRKDR